MRELKRMLVAPWVIKFGYLCIQEILAVTKSCALGINTFAHETARNRPCGSTSFLPFVTSSVLTVKDNFVR